MGEIVLASGVANHSVVNGWVVRETSNPITPVSTVSEEMVDHVGRVHSHFCEAENVFGPGI